ncbi:MAG: hypothetical protein NTV00_16060 [Methylococcales bacterium]|nr:hypothetical protein [Methylococcales bacterium]
MKLNLNYRHVFFGVAAIFALSFLFNEIRTSNPKHAEGMFERINEISLINSALNEDLWRYQLGVLTDYNGMNKKIAELKQLKTALAEGEYAVTNLNDANTAALFNAVDLNLSAKERQVEDFFISICKVKTPAFQAGRFISIFRG